MEALISEREIAGTEAAWQAAELGLQVKLAGLRPHTQNSDRRTDRLAGQLTGAEGWQGRVATRSRACWNEPCVGQGAPVFEPPAVTILGGPLCRVTSADRRSFQPMQSHPGPLTSLCPRAPKAHKERGRRLFRRAKPALGAFPDASGRRLCA